MFCQVIALQSDIFLIKPLCPRSDQRRPDQPLLQLQLRRQLIHWHRPSPDSRVLRMHGAHSQSAAQCPRQQCLPLPRGTSPFAASSFMPLRLACDCVPRRSYEGERANHMSSPRREVYYRWLKGRVRLCTCRMFASGGK